MLSVLIVTDGELATHARSDGGPARLRRALVGPQPPDVLVVDCQSHLSSVVELLATARDAVPEAHLLVVGPREDGPGGLACLRLGAVGVVPRSDVEDGLLRALDRIRDGRPELGAAVGAEVLRAIRASATSRGPGNLTPMQERILSLMATGATNRTIAERLGMAEKTVKNYATAIYAALGVANRTEAVATWVAAGRGEDDASVPGDRAASARAPNDGRRPTNGAHR